MVNLIVFPRRIEICRHPYLLGLYVCGFWKDFLRSLEWSKQNVPQAGFFDWIMTGSVSCWCSYPGRHFCFIIVWHYDTLHIPEWARGSILILYCYPCRQARKFLVCDKFRQGRFGRGNRSMVPKLLEITQNSLARAQRAVHWTNTTSLPQTNSRDSQQHPPWTRALMWTIYSRTRFLWEQQGRKCKVLPAIATSTEYQGRRNVRYSTFPPTWLEMVMRWCWTAFSR